MASVKISHAHHLTVDEAKRRITAAFGGYSAKYNLKLQWAGNRLMVSGPADGHADVSASSVEVAVELGVGASLFKRKIAAAIKDALAEHLKA